ncbi:MAG: transporter substrate-binding domain-containing protein [Candidatus Methylomirabilales bacterium]
MLAYMIVLVVTAGVGSAETPADRKLIVGTKEAPPFAIKRSDGTWKGISIDLWREIAAALNVTYEWRELDLQGLLDGVKDGSLDVAVAALSVTAKREKSIDFTHPYYTTGFSIAVARRAQGFGVVRRLLSWELLQVIVALALVLFIVGLLVWLFERQRNPEQFGGGPAKGIGSGFYWAAVTMTTVGYGDKAPSTVGGRVVALIWMFAGIMMISGFIAAITTTLTVSQLESSVSGPEDLAHVWVATVAGSASEAYLREHDIALKKYPTLLEGLLAVAKGEVDAAVYDAPLLRFLARTELRGEISVVPVTFERQDYGIALPVGSPLREPINRIILEKVHEPVWDEILERYLGK